MNINRHNCEEFFLLYVDNELNADDKSAVDEFLQLNPDLTVEFNMLSMAALSPVEVAFPGKQSLYRETEGISFHNCEEYFLFSLDGELNEAEDNKVQKFLLKHPHLLNEFTLLSKTKLAAEKIEFIGKDQLFRKSVKKRPVIFANFLKIGVAAAVIGFVTMTWFFNQRENVSTASNTHAINKKVANATAPVPSKLSVPVEVAVTRESNAPKAATLPTKKTFTNAAAEKTYKSLVAVKQKPRIIDKMVAESMLAKNDLQNKKASEEVIATAEIMHTDKPVIVRKDLKEIAFVKQDEPATLLATQTVYKELDTRENDEDNTLYIGSIGINKNKLKGFFKKATGFIDRKNSNNGDEKTLRIAGFEIKSK